MYIHTEVKERIGTVHLKVVEAKGLPRIEGDGSISVFAFVRMYGKSFGMVNAHTYVYMYAFKYKNPCVYVYVTYVLVFL